MHRAQNPLRVCCQAILRQRALARGGDWTKGWLQCLASGKGQLVCLCSLAVKFDCGVSGERFGAGGADKQREKVCACVCQLPIASPQGCFFFLHTISSRPQTILCLLVQAALDVGHAYAQSSSGGLRTFSPPGCGAWNSACNTYRLDASSLNFCRCLQTRTRFPTLDC